VPGSRRSVLGRSRLSGPTVRPRRVGAPSVHC
jgi:hypothetical protein